MKRPSCSRTWEAEAIGDGRLDATARSSFERHAATCDECGEELRVLDRIASATRELPKYPSQAIDRRRLRIALLQRANQQLMRRHSPGWGVWAVAAIAVCGLGVAVTAPRWRSLVGAPAVAHLSPTFEVVDVNHASWSTTTTGGTVQVMLSDGTTAVHVEHLTHDQRFFVELPDGELEVRGTRFQLSVSERRTKHLEVSEGVVALRLLGQPQMVLMAGQQWTAPAPLSDATAIENPASPAPSTTQNVAAPASLSRPPLARAPAPSRTRAVEPAPPPVDDAAERVATAPAIDDYPACIRAFESGDYAGADSMLTAFMRSHPSDARSEDAAFLRIVSHTRLGDATGAASLARDYLQRYPHGLRSKEAERLAESGEPPQR
jgi:TolA-binding protein